MVRDKSDEKQISAYVSSRTNERLDMFVRETGIKKARVIEDAINAHLDAIEALPADAIIPTRIVLSDESFDRLVERLESPPDPTPPLRKLMRDKQ